MKKILLFTSILVLSFTTNLYAQHPTNLAASNITSSSVDLSCVATICNGNIHYRYKVSTAATWTNNLNINSNAHSLTSLLPNTSYDWSVKCAGIANWATTETFTTLAIPTGPSIDNVFISDSIVCFDSTGVITIEINQTLLDTPLQLIFGYVAPFGVNYIIKLTSASVNSISTIVVPGLIAKDYVIRLVDPVAYYAANFNGSGSSLDGVYDEYLINLVEPALLTATTSIVSSNLCNSVCIAEEDLSISGGTMPYSFSVNSNPTINLANGDSTYSFVALCEDIYDVVVTDTNGCSTLPSTTSFAIAAPSAIILDGRISFENPNGEHVSCNGESDGEITAASSGGTGALTYAINGSAFQSDSIFPALPAGTYIIGYKDANDCIATESFTLNEPPALFGTAIITDSVDCFEINTGEITFQIDPINPGVLGTGYVYSIDNFINNQTDSTFDNLYGDSTYTVKIMDFNGCMDSSLVYLAEPAQVVYSTILSDYNNYEVSCNDSSDGSIQFTSTNGGFGPYQYSIDSGTTFDLDSIFSGLISNIYNLQVKDNKGCIVLRVDTLNEPGIFSLPYSVDTDIDCYESCNGEIDINALNGVGQILYSIDSGTLQTNSSFPNLCGEVTNTFLPYIFNAIDANDCIADTTILLFEPTDLVSVTDSTLEYCDQADGNASISVTGGTGIFLYSWENVNNSGVVVSSNDTAENLVAGVYTVEVTDANDCLISESVTVLADEGFTISFTAVSPCLGDSSGMATVFPTGLAPYEYQWFDATNDSILVETFATLSNMPIATYSVVVTDATGCVKTGSVDIVSSSNPIAIDSVVVSNFSCFLIDDAQIEIYASGGAGTYNYTNTDGITTMANNSPVFGPLVPNTYTLSAIDTNGCFDDTTVTLSYPDLLKIDSTVFTHISCFGADDGAVQNIQFVGGTGPFEFSIDGGDHQTYMLFSDLSAGQHTVEVWDVNNCASSDFITIEEPDLLNVEITTSGWVFNSTSMTYSYQIRCNGDSSGYIDILSSGGTAPYSVDSTIFFNTINIDSLWAGNHTFVVEDANGCIYQETILFEEPSLILHNFDITDVLCEAWNNGSVTDSVSGGVGSATTYSYLWSSGETTYSLDSLSAATYVITVTDENGCKSADSLIINADSALFVTGVTLANVSCNGGNDGALTVTALGGVTSSGLAPYTYLWDDDIAQNNDTAVNLSVSFSPLISDTIYTCIVTDASGCTASLELFVNQPSAMQLTRVTSSTVPISCYGAADGELTVLADGGTPIYTYFWSNNGTLNNPTNTDLSAGVYKVTVEDANGCRDTVEWSGMYYLNDPTPLEIDTIFDVDISCYEKEDGYIKIFASGGTSYEYTYLYTLYLEGAFNDSVTHIAGSDTLQHDSLEFNSLVPGNYYVIVEDRNGCKDTSLSVEITEPSAELTVLVDSDNETCLSNSPGENGIIRVTPQGGSQLFKYFIDSVAVGSFTNFSPNAFISEDTIANGWHNILVVDSRNCSISDVTYIKAYDPIFLPDTVSNLEYTICLGQSIDIEVEERPNLTYTWDDGVIGGDRVIKPEGILPYGTIGYTTEYVVTVTDLQGCEIQNIVTVHFDAIDPMIDSDPGVLYGEYPVVLEGGNIDLFSNNTGNDIEYTWKWADNIVINTGDNSITISELLADVWYYLDIKDADGCLGYDSIYVVVGVKSLGESTVYEAITPNNDGFNDTWTPLNIESYKNAVVQVFSRWGGLVFESNGGENYQAWDGTNSGKELAVGTYYYIIDLNTGDEPQTGPITIIR